MFQVNEDLQITWAGESFLGALGYGALALVGERLSRVFGDPDGIEAHRFFLAVQERQTARIETWLIKSDGTPVWGTLSCEPVIQREGTYSHTSGVLSLPSTRRPAEEASDSLARQFLLATELSNTGLFDWDTRTNEVRYSKIWKRQLGYEEHELRDHFEEWYSRLHPDDLATTMSRVEAYLSNPSESYEGEFRMRHKNGEYRWIRAQGSLVMSEDGTPLRMMGCHIDITERKVADAAFKESQLRMQALFEHALNGILMMDDTGRYVEANPAACKILGYDREELLKMTAVDVFQDGRPSEVYLKGWQRFLQGDSPRGILALHKRDGSMITVEYSAVSHVLPGIHLSILSDVTEKQATEDALKLARFTLDHATIAVFWIRTDGSFIDFNEEACRSLGYSREEMLRLDVADIDPNHPKETWPVHWEALREAGSLTFQSVQRRKDGSLVDVEISAHYLQFGDIELNCAFVRDITDIQRAAQERAGLESQLREAQKMEAIGTLAGGIAHDFNNILGAIIGNLDLARQDVGDDSPAQVSLSEINRAAVRAKGLVQQILTFSRRQPNEFAVLDLVPLVSEGIGMLRAIFPSGITISADLGAESILANVDSTQINQILMNLCTNAWHAMQSATGIIRISLSQAEVNPEILPKAKNLPSGRYALLRVADQGIGIPAEAIDRIFEPFYTTKAIGHGTGLGLSVVHGIVKEHGGAVFVESEAGLGTIFDVYLPLVEEPDMDRGAKSASMSGSSGGGQHILYVDDEEAMVFMMRRALERKGYRVSAFEHPHDALEAFRDDPYSFDVVVTDQNMPGASGLDVTRKIREMRPEMPIAIISGFVSDDLVRQANAVGVTELLYKPNSVQELCDAIRKLVG